MAGAGSRSGERKAHILQAFATMLEQHPGGRITTAALAREVGVSEAALYRHFASKAQMFEGLISFLEETVLGQVPAIKQEVSQAPERCGALLTVLLSFCAKNPGFARLLTGDVLAGETERLRKRMAQLFERIETQLRQFIRDGELAQGQRTRLPAALCANLMLAAAEGRIAQFVRGGFEPTPLEHWPHQWQTLAEACFDPPAPDLARPGPAPLAP